MALLPFRRLAILESSLFLKNPGRNLFNIQKVLDNRADAIYFRFKNTSEVQIATVLKEARPLLEQKNIFIMFPGNMAGSIFECDAYQFAENEIFPPDLKGKFLLGRSCHSQDAVTKAAKFNFDYVFLSPIFSTPSHPGKKGLGLEILSETCKKSELPVVALGGISGENKESCFQAGAAAIAGITLFLN